MKSFSIISLAGFLAAFPFLTACNALTVGSPVKEVKEGPPSAANYKDAINLELDTQDYTKWLQKNYKALTLFEYDEMFDYDSAEHFAYKSLAAGRGTILKPDSVSSRVIDSRYQAEAESMYGFIQDAYSRGKNRDNPKDMARLQVSYDCWLEQIEEDIQPNHILKCKEIFYDAWEKLKDPPPQEIKKFPAVVEVYFDTGSSEINSEEMRILQETVTNQNIAHEKIVIEGYADTVDTSGYNQSLSQRRAEAIKMVIQNADSNITDISISAYGETRLAVPTNDKIAEPRNRRAIIYFK